MPVCPHCAAEVPDSAAACPACGGSIAAPAASPHTKPKISGHAIAALYLSLTALVVPVAVVYFARTNPLVEDYLEKMYHGQAKFVVLLSFISLVLTAISIRAGRKARKQVRSSDGLLKGKGRAWAGLILGSLGFFWYLFILLL